MKALSKLKAEPGIWMVKDAEVPKISPSEVLIKIRKTAICGTDLHIYNWDEWSQKTIPVPMITGHEYVGEVVEIGSDVTTVKVGQRVSGEGHLVCGRCRNCRGGRLHLCPKTVGIGVNIQGAFAEYMKLPASNVCPIPDEISDDIASIFDPFGNAVHTALSFNLVGEDVLITGAGSIGIMAAMVCKHAGARHVVITDINPYRLELARKCGIEHAINVAETDLNDLKKKLHILEGFDVALEMSGAAPAFQTIFDHIIHGGKIALLGIPPGEMKIDWNQVIFKGLTLKGIYGREMYETWHKMKMMVMGGLDLTPIITHHFPIDEYQDAFETMASGQSGKVILDWT
ncbi:MAG: L-threonine 3-dehydrogenase [Pseudomonadota bacterium]|jgi:threonine 3-dehydrogenase|nr:L-threonine 3-dehydrogenase [Pseudomonadota bacterium]MEC9235618.1 L-threonine 3-dehydrogenase [Pseudomonadota bacterium]MEE3322492.1 L-threonine 3-dehydrogenase [Pseudomonadota bacterium]